MPDMARRICARALEENEITFTMETIMLSAPRLDTRVASTAAMIRCNAGLESMFEQGLYNCCHVVPVLAIQQNDTSDND
jgi:hypothetical protein